VVVVGVRFKEREDKTAVGSVSCAKIKNPPKWPAKTAQRANEFSNTANENWLELGRCTLGCALPKVQSHYQQRNTRHKSLLYNDRLARPTNPSFEQSFTMGHAAGLRAGTRYAFSRNFRQKVNHTLTTALPDRS
jgi:hypothetical protein